jgi:hypothetical protein
MSMLRAGLIYFAIVFGVGFVLGVIRTVWVVPRFGIRKAELMEAPLMLVAIVVAARWVVGHFMGSSEPFSLLGMGFIALGLILATEFSVVLWMRKLTIKKYLAERDPVSGAVFYLLLGLFAIMPLLLSF